MPSSLPDILAYKVGLQLGPVELRVRQEAAVAVEIVNPGVASFPPSTHLEACLATRPAIGPLSQGAHGILCAFSRGLYSTVVSEPLRQRWCSFIKLYVVRDISSQGFLTLACNLR